MSDERPSIRVKRVGTPCCGMVQDGEYDAKGSVDSYVSVHLYDGTWTSDHYAPGFFEEVSSDDRPKDG